MVSKSEFLKKYCISEAEFDEKELSWEELMAIYEDYSKKTGEFELISKFISDCFRNNPHVHSIRYRVKDPEHLIEKIIRKKMKNPAKEFTVENYEKEITDLIGIRVIHLFKEDWEAIHNFILEQWPKPQKRPEANVRAGDSDHFIKRFIDKGCKILIHPFGYRSVHYLVPVTMIKLPRVAEIQVRTIFEEAWSEIDHRIRYPYQVHNKVISNYLEIFNRLAGSSDEMGSFIQFLNTHLVTMETNYQRDIEEKNRIILDLKSRIEKLEIEKEEKAEIEKSLTILDKAVGSSLKTYDTFFEGGFTETLNMAFDTLKSIDGEELKQQIGDVFQTISNLNKNEIQSMLIKSLSAINQETNVKEEPQIDVTPKEKAE